MTVDADIYDLMDDIPDGLTDDEKGALHALVAAMEILDRNDEAAHLKDGVRSVLRRLSYAVERAAIDAEFGIGAHHDEQRSHCAAKCRSR